MFRILCQSWVQVSVSIVQNCWLYNWQPSNQASSTETFPIPQVNRQIPTPHNDQVCLIVPNKKRHVLSAYQMSAKGAPLLAGNADYDGWNSIQNKTIILIQAYLNFPPVISCPGLMNEMLITSPIMLVQMLGIPNKVRGQKQIREKI